MLYRQRNNAVGTVKVREHSSQVGRHANLLRSCYNEAVKQLQQGGHRKVIGLNSCQLSFINLAEIS